MLWTLAFRHGLHAGPDTSENERQRDSSPYKISNVYLESRRFKSIALMGKKWGSGLTIEKMTLGGKHNEGPELSLLPDII
jgi:hypothetical protein